MSHHLKRLPINNYKNKTIFFLCTGPSLNQYDLSLLENKFTYSTKIIPLTHLKTTFWAAAEKARQIPWEILEDKTIIKFVTEELWHTNYIKEGILKKYKDLKNLYYFNLSPHYHSSTFFSSPDITWGLPKGVKDEDGFQGRRSLMFASFKIFYLLGFSRIILLGCDFNMNPEKSYCYERNKGIVACQENNLLYETLQKRFERLKPYLNNLNIEVFNCNKDSRLTVFPYQSFESCLQYV